MGDDLRSVGGPDELQKSGVHMRVGGNVLELEKRRHPRIKSNQDPVC